MASEKNMRMEELESRQQEMQEKIFQAMKMRMDLTKEKEITDGPSLQKKSLHPGKVALIHPLSQIRMTPQNKENWEKNRLDSQITSTCSKCAVS